MKYHCCDKRRLPQPGLPVFKRSGLKLQAVSLTLDQARASTIIGGCLETPGFDVIQQGGSNSNVGRCSHASFLLSFRDAGAIPKTPTTEVRSSRQTYS